VTYVLYHAPYISITRQTIPQDLMLYPVHKIIPHLPLSHSHPSYPYSLFSDRTTSEIDDAKQTSKIAHSTPQKGRAPLN